MPSNDTAIKPGTSLRRLAKVVGSLFRHRQFGMALFWATFGPAMFFFARLALEMDNVLYPRLKDVKIRRPVFVMGHPRSGTTFLQKRLYEVGNIAMFTTWEMVFPSIIMRRVMQPWIRLFTKTVGDQIVSDAKGHGIRLEGVEEDEGIFLHRMDGELMIALSPWLLIDESTAGWALTLGWNDRSGDRKSVRFFHECLRRQVFYTGKQQVLAKFNPSVFRIKTLLAEFPDARFVYLVRSPRDTVRSWMNLQRRMVVPPLSESERHDFYRNKYQWGLELYRYFESVKEGIPQEQLLVIPFPQLQHHPADTMKKFFEFSGLQAEEKLQDTSNRELKRAHVKKHTNLPLVTFGITEEQIERDLGFVSDKYGV